MKFKGFTLIELIVVVIIIAIIAALVYPVLCRAWDKAHGMKPSKLSQTIMP